MTRLKAESNYNNNWQKMIEQTQSMTDWAKEEKRASVKSTYASDMRKACINLEAENESFKKEIERLRVENKKYMEHITLKHLSEQIVYCANCSKKVK